MVRGEPRNKKPTFRTSHSLRCADIKTLTEDDPTLLEKARAAFQKYNEEQLTTVKLPGSGKNVREHST